MEFKDKLSTWYAANKRALPWRETNSPYYIWLSEVILQQTQVKQGLPYYLKFIDAFPTVFHLAKAKEIEVLNLWQGLGYYSRARNLHATAKFVADQLNGQFPDTYDDLIALKGIGDYTASAIASICFNRPTPVVDGNVYRFLSRYFGIDTPINSTQGKKVFKQLAQELIDTTNPGDFNQAIMEFGGRQCKPQNPDCSVCPFNSECVALQQKSVDTLPVKLKKPSIKKRYFNFLVLLSDDGQTLLEQRDESGIWKKLYQFPLVETSKRASLETITNSDVLKNLLVGNPFDISVYNEKEWIHKLSHQHLHTRFWIVTLKELPFKGIPVSRLSDYPVPILIHNFINEFKF